MAENPLKYSDLIEDDGAIDKAINKLESLNEAYTKMLGEVKKNAETLVKAMEKLSGATDDGRESTKRAATEAEQLAREQQKLVKAQKDVSTELARLRMQRQKITQEQKLQIKVNEAEEGSYNQLSAQYSLNKMRLNAMSKEMRENTEEGRALVEQTKQLYERMKQLQEETGKYTLDVGHYSKAWDTLRTEMANTGGVTGIVAGGFNTVKAAADKLAAHPIIAIFVALAAVIGKLFSAFLKTEEGISLVNKASAVLSGGFSLLVKLSKNIYEGFKTIFTDPVQWVKDLGSAIYQNIVNRFMAIPKLGKAVYNVLKGVFTLDGEQLNESLKEAGEALVQINTGMTTSDIDAFANSIKGLTGEVNNQIQAFIDLAEARRAAIKGNRELEKQVADLSVKEQLLQSIADDATKSFAEREAAAAKADELTKQRAKIQMDIAKQNLDLINTEVDLKNKAGQVDDELLDKQVEAYKTLRDAESEYYLAVQDNDKRQSELKQDRLERDLDILIDGFDNQKTINERLIADETKTFEERRKILDDTRKLSDESFKRQIETIQQFTGIQVDANELINEQDAVSLNQKIRNLGLSEIIEGRLLEIVRERRIVNQDLAESERDLAVAQKEANEERIKSEKESADKLLESRQNEIDQEYDLRNTEIDLLKVTEDEKTKLRLEAEKERIEKILKLQESGIAQMSSLEVQAIRNTISKIDEEIDALSKNKNNNRDIYDLVGLKLDSDEKQAISEAVGFSIEQLQSILDAQVQIKEQALQNAQEEVDAAQERLDKEIEARNNGYANDVETAQKELQLAKQKEEQALKEKQKAQRQQQALDSLTQASSLITASANIWSSLSGIPIIGYALAIAAIATMWTSFAAAKIKARELTTTEYGEGGMEFLSGGSHQSGNDIDLGTMPDGSNRRAEGGAALAIINKASTRKYRKALPGIIKSINNGTFEKKYLNAFASDGVSMNVNFMFDNKEIERDVREIKEQNSRRIYIDGNGNMIESYKNLRRKIKRL